MIDLPDGWHSHPSPGSGTTHWLVSGRCIVGAISEALDGICAVRATVAGSETTRTTLEAAKRLCEACGQQKGLEG